MVVNKDINIDRRSVSVVIPTRSSENFIEQTIKAIYHSLQEIITEIVLVVPQSDVATLKVLRSISQEYLLKIITTKEVLGQHQSTLRGILATSNPTVLTLDDDVVFTDPSLSQLISGIDIEQDIFYYFILPEYRFTERIKMMIVSYVIKFASRGKFDLKRGSSQRLFDKTLLLKAFNEEDLDHYIDALLPVSDYQGKTITSAFRKLEHQSRHTVGSRAALLWMAVKNYNTTFLSKFIMLGIFVIIMILFLMLTLW